MERILAAIDIGTNSFHLVVAKVTSNKSFTVLTKDKEVVRLGSASKDMKYIQGEAMERAISTLKRFKKICDSFNAEIRAIATSATREALNKEEFLKRAKEEAGINIEVVSGYEEARLIYLGVLQALNVFDRKILLVDIGGGSTEFLIGKKGNVKYARSVKIGAVRLTQKYFPDGQNKTEDIQRARAFVRGEIYHVARELKDKKYDIIIGTSGTITTLGAMIAHTKNLAEEEEMNLNNYTYTSDALYSVVKKIVKAESSNDKKTLKGLDPKRIDIITAGSIILEQIFSELKLKNLTISSYALREGIILDTINKYYGTDELGHLSDVRYKSVMHLCEAMNCDTDHSVQVAKLALSIFDQVKERAGLTDNDSAYLEAAAIMHDIGYYISHSQHHKHSYYIIRNSELLGFNDNEIEIIANTARYHRKSHPKAKHENFSKLSVADRDKVRKLSGIIRIADGLDRSHKQFVKDLNFDMKDDTLTISLKSNFDAELEIWGAMRRKDLFEEVMGLKVEIKK